MKTNLQGISQQQLKAACLNATSFSNEVLQYLAQENLWNIWVPQEYGGQALSLTQGLKKLQAVATIDGSLGWTLTLCSGANFFVGNLAHEAAAEVFKGKENTILGGSGGVFGEAHQEEGQYRINGTWHYATGAPYLTHFTLNARIMNAGKPVKDDNGNDLIKSFVLPKEAVKIIPNWSSMGLKATATHSFQVSDYRVAPRFSFVYHEVKHTADLYQIPFLIFADFTLWINYIGMAQHFLALASFKEAQPAWRILNTRLKEGEKRLYDLALQTERRLDNSTFGWEEWVVEVHQAAVQSVQAISQAIIGLYPFLGISASKEGTELNQVFKDYFTATQHHIFTKKR
ncbi:acyl-CoA dehydrogenase [Mesonia sp. HuA40]|uniref:acyl-CoA dehydrogenase n=1 Tax=Mesonia sp. HuA40 TaxID=2602761 RepID=UPI00210667AC|nr:acyl-CoA dehydrogenase [Mesonia sp. HuA40]